MRAVEQLHYHSAHNPRYIDEISQALRDTGIMAKETQELIMELKESFKQTRLWRNGIIWVNRRIENDNTDINSLEDKSLLTHYEAELPTGHSREINPFSLTMEGKNEPIKRSTSIVKISQLLPQVVRKALSKDPFFTFSNLKHEFGNLKSITEFITSNKYLGGVSIELTADTEDLDNLNVAQQLYVLEKVLALIKNAAASDDTRWVGTDTFEPVALNQSIKERVKLKIAISDSSDGEYGKSTVTRPDGRYYVDLHNADWYAYKDNFGTSEEKSLVKTLEALKGELSTKWDDIYLVRNERFIKIYAFDDGSAFEPDYILFANDKKMGNVSWQVFIEPKGDQFLDATKTGFDDGKEGWKQKFLLQIEDKFKTATLLEDDNYRVVGLPFYNERHTKEQFIEQLQKVV